MEESIIEQKAHITRRYVLALSLIAMLSTIAFYSIHRVLKESDKTAYIVNISGKQRMLSQHIALDVHRMHKLINENGLNAGYDDLLSQQVLRQHVDEMLSANKVLSTGSFKDGTSVELSETIHDIYFGDINLAQRVKDYCSVALQMVDVKSHEDVDRIIRAVDATSEQLLIDLNKAVQQYQREGEARLETLQNLESVVWVMTIIILLLEVIFIFQPMARQIVSMSDSNIHTLKYLESLVENRSMHLEKLNQQLADMAMHDPLTGLRNRLNLEQDIENAIKHFKLHRAHFAVLMFDIDFFKSVNDEYGHDIGDTVLKTVAELLKESVREEDRIYRAGGEEFVILMNRIDLIDTINVAEKIRTVISNYGFDVDGKQIHKTVSGGLYHSSLRQTDETSIVLKLVDNALYASKMNGRDRITNVTGDGQGDATSVNIPEIVIVFDSDVYKNVIAIDGKVEQFDWLPVAELRDGSLTFEERIHPDDVHLLTEVPPNAVSSNPYITTLRLLGNDESVMILRAEFFHDEGKPHCRLRDVRLLAQVVSDRVMIRNFNAMLERSDDYIYFKDRNHLFTAASDSFISITPVKSGSDLIGKTDYEVFDKIHADEYFKLERQVFDGKLEVAQDFQPIVDHERNEGWVDNRKYPIRNSQGVIVGLFGIARVISDKEYGKLCQRLDREIHGRSQ
jgi:diguanylate cyclase (GGDEF)-like protein